MEMIKQDIRFKPEKWENIKEIAKEENKTIQETVRELCSIGISYKFSIKDDESKVKLSIKDEIMLGLLFKIHGNLNRFSNQFLEDFKNEKGVTFKEINDKSITDLEDCFEKVISGKLRYRNK